MSILAITLRSSGDKVDGHIDWSGAKAGRGENGSLLLTMTGAATCLLRQRQSASDANEI